MQRLDASFAPPDAAAPPAEAAARREEAGRLLSVLRDLPPRQQEVVWLRFRGGLTYREIAEVCRISVNNVGVMLHTAIRSLRVHLERVPVSAAAKEPS